MPPPDTERARTEECTWHLYGVEPAPKDVEGTGKTVIYTFNRYQNIFGKRGIFLVIRLQILWYADSMQRIDVDRALTRRREISCSQQLSSLCTLDSLRLVA